MSYFCMIVTQNGTIAASDSRLSSANGPFTILSESEQKLFYSREGKMLWGYTGIATLDGTNFKDEGNKILSDDSVPLHKRFKEYVSYMKNATKYYYRRTGITANASIVYAAYYDKFHPEIGSLTITNGKLDGHPLYQYPTILEAGSNQYLLTKMDSSLCLLDRPMEFFQEIAVNRVREAIAKDVEMSSIHRNYRPHVGGKIQVKAIKVKR